MTAMFANAPVGSAVAVFGRMSICGYGVPLWRMVKVAEPMVTVPVRSRKLGLVLMAKVTVEFPFFAPGSTTEIHEAFDVAFQLVVERAATSTMTISELYAFSEEYGAMFTSVPVCETVNVWPPMRIEPVLVTTPE